MRALIVPALIVIGSMLGCWGFVTGCAARQAAIADTVITTACDEAMTKCGDCMESGKCTEDQATACVTCTYGACQVIREQVWERAE